MSSYFLVEVLHTIGTNAQCLFHLASVKIQDISMPSQSHFQSTPLVARATYQSTIGSMQVLEPVFINNKIQ